MFGEVDSLRRNNEYRIYFSGGIGYGDLHAVSKGDRGSVRPDCRRHVHKGHVVLIKLGTQTEQE